jgi:predicted enzyme related to lactoylglutathione lyase
MPPKPGAVLYAQDIQRIAKFYEGVALLTVVHAEPDHVVLESDAIQLVIHAIPKAIADTITITEPPLVREDTPIKLFFPVPSLADARARAAALGGCLSPSHKEWEWPAHGFFRVCDGCDPEGNVLQLRQDLVSLP